MKKLVSLTSRAFTFGMAVLSIPALALAQATLVELVGDGEVTEAGVVVSVEIECMDDSRAADVGVRLKQLIAEKRRHGNDHILGVDEADPLAHRFPAGIWRGGMFRGGRGSGWFAFRATHAPSASGATVSFRCAR
jgi:hypothetical protein